MTDRSGELAAAIAAAAARQQALYIGGGGSKRELLGRDCEVPVLDVSGHRGITDYQPSELVLTARAGTPLVEILAVLEQERQTLAFEPPRLGGRATLGGTVACNMSGPSRPWTGSARDLVLGVQLIDGRGQLLNFGGQVMKNVAGYDVSRLQAGAQGTLGVLSEISLKVMPLPEHSLTLAYDMDADAAIDCMNRRSGAPSPLSGACWLDGRLLLRLSGNGSAVEHSADVWGGERLAGGADFWRDLREMRLPFFSGPEPLWRLSLRPTASSGDTSRPTLIDWGGAQRWLRGDFQLETLQQTAAQAGGNASLFRGGNRKGEVRPMPDAVSVRLQQQLKRAFDPLGILNPGRLYGWL
ncbi:MAG: glycolate oxidase subunit GlcE [Halieaceae bacterium]|jgi:glycolate oxidase FAD binding subunit|nr:glycolate oxidase subunit GlcE [Halieaceae bacterium]